MSDRWHSKLRSCTKYFPLVVNFSSLGQSLYYAEVFKHVSPRPMKLHSETVFNNWFMVHAHTQCESALRHILQCHGLLCHCYRMPQKCRCYRCTYFYTAGTFSGHGEHGHNIYIHYVGSPQAFKAHLSASTI